MVNDWLVHLDIEGEATSDPIVIFLADSHVYDSLLALLSKG